MCVVWCVSTKTIYIRDPAAAMQNPPNGFAYFCRRLKKFIVSSAHDVRWRPAFLLICVKLKNVPHQVSAIFYVYIYIIQIMRKILYIYGQKNSKCGQGMFKCGAHAIIYKMRRKKTVFCYFIDPKKMCVPL